MSGGVYLLPAMPIVDVDDDRKKMGTTYQYLTRGDP